MLNLIRQYKLHFGIAIITNIIFLRVFIMEVMFTKLQNT